MIYDAECCDSARLTSSQPLLKSMQRLKTTLIALALSSTSLAAQFTTPAGYLSTEGKTWQNVATLNGYSYYFGRTSVQHYQQVDAEIKKKGLQVLTSVGFRPDYQNHTNFSAAGRNWSNVTLKLSDGDHATMSSTFAANQLSTPSMVFSGSVTWPHITGNPTSQPAPWDSQYAFPFGTGGGSGIYMYTATTDLCLDFTFTGGTLLNNLGWSGTQGRNYFFDGIYTLTATTYGRQVYKFIGTTTANCTDSFHTSGYASGSIQVGLYGKGYTQTPAWTGKAVMHIFGARTAPNSFVLHAIGIGGTTPGLSIPALGCYNLMFDMTQLLTIYNIATNAAGSRAWLHVPIADLSILAPLGRTVSIWSQAAWAESKSGKTMLTTAERCTPDFARKLNATVPLKKSIYWHDSSPTGYGPYNYWFINPITRYN
jgi:hypothetical protein